MRKRKQMSQYNPNRVKTCWLCRKKQVQMSWLMRGKRLTWTSESRLCLSNLRCWRRMWLSIEASRVLFRTGFKWKPWANWGATRCSGHLRSLQMHLWEPRRWLRRVYEDQWGKRDRCSRRCREGQGAVVNRAREVSRETSRRPGARQWSRIIWRWRKWNWRRK